MITGAAAQEAMVSSAVVAEDDDVMAWGTSDTNLTWILVEKGTLPISGKGKMQDDSFSGVLWNSYKTSIKSLVLNSGLQIIGDYAFYGCSGMTGVKELTVTNLTPPASTANLLSGLTNLQSTYVPAGAYNFIRALFLKPTVKIM